MPDCAPPRDPHFDVDIHDCACGHPYGAHEYEYSMAAQTMVIARCLDCDYRDVLADVTCDALICDAPFSPRVHDGQRTGTFTRRSTIDVCASCVDALASVARLEDKAT